MSGWHRDNPELVGTDADPWMMHPSYAAAHREVTLQQAGQAAMRRAGYGSIEEAMEDSTHSCSSCDQVQGLRRAPTCASCSGAGTCGSWCWSGQLVHHVQACAGCGGTGRLCRHCAGPLVEREP